MISPMVLSAFLIAMCSMKTWRMERRIGASAFKWNSGNIIQIRPLS